MDSTVRKTEEFGQVGAKTFEVFTFTVIFYQLDDHGNYFVSHPATVVE